MSGINVWGEEPGDGEWGTLGDLLQDRIDEDEDQGGEGATHD